eukprot:scaffold2113_cov119-Isochrysis_galbana.AAC.4
MPQGVAVAPRCSPSAQPPRSAHQWQIRETAAALRLVVAAGRGTAVRPPQPRPASAGLRPWPGAPLCHQSAWPEAAKATQRRRLSAVYSADPARRESHPDRADGARACRVHTTCSGGSGGLCCCFQPAAISCLRRQHVDRCRCGAAAHHAGPRAQQPDHHRARGRHAAHRDGHRPHPRAGRQQHGLGRRGDAAAECHAVLQVHPPQCARPSCHPQRRNVDAQARGGLWISCPRALGLLAPGGCPTGCAVFVPALKAKARGARPVPLPRGT